MKVLNFEDVEIKQIGSEEILINANDKFAATYLIMIPRDQLSTTKSKIQIGF